MLAEDKFIPELLLRLPGFTYSACGQFTEHRERIQKLKKNGDLNYIYKNELDKPCFAHDAAYSDSEDLAKRTISEKILKDRAYEVDRNLKYGYQKRLATMVYKFFDNKTGSGSNVNKVLAQQ